MLAPVSNSRAQHDGFAVLVVIVLVIAACVAGYWYAQRSVEVGPKSDATQTVLPERDATPEKSG